VTTDESGVKDVERLIVDVLRWHSLEVDATTCDTLADVVRAISRGLEGISKDSPSDVPAAVRVKVTGQSRAHGELFGLEQQLREEVIASAAVIGTDRIWVEKVKIATSPAMVSPRNDHLSDAVSDLETLFVAAETDQEFLNSLRDELMDLVAKAPLELQGSVPWFEVIRQGNVAELVREISPALVAQLAKAG
jgi:hypothetical protein